MDSMFDDCWKRSMHWEIVWPRKVLSFRTGAVRDEEIQTGTDFDELVELIEYSYKHQEEITLTLSEIDPSDEMLGEPAMSADERWEAAFNQKRELQK